MKFPQSFIEEVRTAADIVVVVSDYVSLKKVGTAYKGLCPFHGEKSPSFHVHRDRGFFHCFGCGVGGDVFKFLELHDKVGFSDALRLVAGRFGIQVPEGEGDEGGETAAERESLLNVHEVATSFFHDALRSATGARVRTYLERERGLTSATVDALRLGMAGPHRTALRQHLLDQGFAPLLLLKSGLVVRRDDGNEVDRFRNRLMVPIARETGSVIAFGGRALEEGQGPKYLNSPETPIYSKSRTLFGLHLTKAAVRKSGFAVLVEGYFDFAQLFQAGALPVVATCGTALTPHQARMLRRFGPKAVLSYDSDTAGQGAAARSSELLVEEGFDVNVALLPPGEDPDTFIQRHGRDAYVARLRDSQPYLEYLMDRAATLHDVRREDGRRQFLGAMLVVAARIPDAAARDHFADRLAHKANITEEVIRAEIRKAAVARRTSLPAQPVTSVTMPLKAAERGLVWALVHAPGVALTRIGTLQDEEIEGLASASVLRAAQQIRADQVLEMPFALFERLTSVEVAMVTAVAAVAEQSVPPVQECIDVLRQAHLERRGAHLQVRIGQSGTGPGATELNDLLRRKNQLASAVDQARRAQNRKV